MQYLQNIRLLLKSIQPDFKIDSSLTYKDFIGTILYKFSQPIKFKNEKFKI